MFDHLHSVIGLLPGESHEDLVASEEVAFETTCRELADGWVDEERHVLPVLETIPPGPFLSVLVESVDRSRVNGFELVRLLQAIERMVSHLQAEGMATTMHVAHSAGGGPDAPPEMVLESAEFAADEIRAALTLTRRAAENRLGLATDLRERLPRVWEMLSQGLIDLARARAIVNGTCHLDESEARLVADLVADRAPHLTTGQLAAWVRRLCVESGPDEANRRYERAVEARRLWVEQTIDGTGNLHLLDIPIEEATAIGRRVNAHMLSLRKSGDNRTHDQLRADITIDMLLGADPANGGRGLVDIRVPFSVLAGWDDRAAEITGMGPVLADVARQYADRHPKAIWQATITDDEGDVIDVVTTRRRPSAPLARHVRSVHPTCTFPGCRMPAADCDIDHLLPFSKNGPTEPANLGPKCRHDHRLKDHGWRHDHSDGVDTWTSPLGHTYVTTKPP